MDSVFKALADQAAANGSTDCSAATARRLGQLCEDLQMSRQAVTQHLPCWKPRTW